jgi:hypothetical protein
MKRVGISLQRILKNEYGDAYEGDLAKKKPREIMKERNPRLAHLTPSEALASLKSELKAYVDGDDPFDRAFRTDETVRQWWVAVQKKQYGGVLGVCLAFTSTALDIINPHIFRLSLSNYIPLLLYPWRMNAPCLLSHG